MVVALPEWFGEDSHFANAISALAFGLAAWSLYLQRRDKRPRLTFSVQKERRSPQTYDAATDHAILHPPEWALIITIRNVGDRRIQLTKVAARWIWGVGAIVPVKWEEARDIETEGVSWAILSFKDFPDPTSQIEKLLPIYRVDFLDHLGRVWGSGFRWIRRSKRMSNQPDPQPPQATP